MQPWAQPCLLLLCLQGGCAQLCRPPSWEPHVPTVFAGHRAEPAFPARRHSPLLCLHCGRVCPLHRAREDPRLSAGLQGAPNMSPLLCTAPGEGTRGRSRCGRASEAQALLPSRHPASVGSACSAELQGEKHQRPFPSPPVFIPSSIA